MLLRKLIDIEKNLIYYPYEKLFKSRLLEFFLRAKKGKVFSKNLNLRENIHA